MWSYTSLKSPVWAPSVNHFGIPEILSTPRTHWVSELLSPPSKVHWFCIFFCLLGKMDCVGYKAKLGIKAGWYVTSSQGSADPLLAHLKEESLEEAKSHTLAVIHCNPNQWMCYFLMPLFELSPHLHSPQTGKTAYSHWPKCNIKISFMANLIHLEFLWRQMSDGAQICSHYFSNHNPEAQNQKNQEGFQEKQWIRHLFCLLFAPRYH